MTTIEELEARIEKLERNLNIVCSDINIHMTSDHDWESNYCNLE